MDCESDEEEEVELEERDIDLEGQVPSLHPQIGTDVFVDRPGELIVQFPCDKRQKDSADGDDTRYSNQKGFCIRPDSDINIIVIEETSDRILDLFHLYRSVQQQSDVEQTQPNYLDSIFQSKSVIGQEQLV